MRTNKKFDTYLRSKGWIWWAVLLHNLEIYFENIWQKFYLLDYSTLSLRDVCEKVWYIWMENNERDNFILELDSTIAYFK